MLKVSFALILAVLAVTWAEGRVQQHRGLTADGPAEHPYLFLTVPRGRAGSVVQGFEVLEKEVDDEPNAASDDDNDGAENDDDEDDPIVGFVQSGDSRAALSDEDIENDDQGEDDDEKDSNTQGQVVGTKMTSPIQTNLQMILQNAKPTQMMISKEDAGAIMVPDGIIEIEGQRVIDEKTGKPALLVPREALDAIPDGSVVALMERSAGDLAHEDEEERANRVIVRRRRKGSRRKVRRHGGSRNTRRRVNYKNSNRYNQYNNRNQRRRGVNRRNVRVIRNGSNNRKRQGNRRRGSYRPIYIQDDY